MPSVETSELLRNGWNNNFEPVFGRIKKELLDILGNRLIHILERWISITFKSHKTGSREKDLVVAWARVMCQTNPRREQRLPHAERESWAVQMLAQETRDTCSLQLLWHSPSHPPDATAEGVGWMKNTLQEPGAFKDIFFIFSLQPLFCFHFIKTWVQPWVIRQTPVLFTAWTMKTSLVCF